MIDKSSLLKSQGSLYLEFIPKDGLFHKMLLLSLMGFLTGWCNLLWLVGEIPVFLACPDVDPMHSPKIGYSLCSQ